LFEPKVRGFVKVPINDLAAVSAAINDRTVAIMLEPVQGEGGVIPADRDYLRALRELTHAHNILLILDEVQTGMGRTGSLFAYQQAGITPDILTLGKGLGGGTPLSALVAHETICCFEHGDQGGTFSGNALLTAVGCAVFNTIAQPDFLRQVRTQGNYLREQLRRISDAYQLGEVRGSGLLVALDVPQNNAPAIARAAFDISLLVNAPRANVLRFMPALNVTPAEIDAMADLLSKAIAQTAARSSAA